MTSFTIEVSYNTISDTDVGGIITDKLWTTDNINDLADAIVEEVQLEEREEPLGMLCRRILRVLGE